MRDTSSTGRMLRAIIIATAAAVAAVPSQAAAQAPAAATAQRQFEPRPVLLEDISSAEAQSATGLADLFLLRERQLFSATGSVGYGFSTNAFATDQRRQHDHVFRPRAALQAATLIDETWDVFLEVGAEAARYARFAELDNDTLSLRGGVGREFGPLLLGMQFDASTVRGPELGTKLVDQIGVTAYAAVPFVLLDAVQIVPRFLVTRVQADPGDYTYTRWAGGASARVPLTMLTSAGRLSLFGDVDVFRREYDNFFESITNLSRRETGLNAAVGVDWRVTDMFSVQASVRYSWTDSSVDPLNYREWFFGPTFGIVVRF